MASLSSVPGSVLCAHLDYLATFSEKFMCYFLHFAVGETEVRRGLVM